MPVIAPLIIILLVILGMSGIFTPDVELTIIGAGNPGMILGSGDINVVVQNNGKKTAEESKIQVEVSGTHIQTTRMGWTGGDIPPGGSSSMNVQVNVTSNGQGTFSVSIYYNGLYQSHWH